MKSVLSACLTAAVFLLARPASPVQDAALRDKVIEAFRVHEPAWRLPSSEHLPYHDELKYELLSFKLVADDAYGEVLIFVHRSQKDAGPTLKGLVEVEEVLQLRKAILKNAEESFGDESYAWEGRGVDKGRSGYIFRHGRAVVFVGSSTRRMAVRLASLTLDALG